MKLLFDENLSPKLAGRLHDLFPGSVHVHDCGLGNVDDLIIWNHAAANGFTLVSKDADFHALSVLKGAPPKLVWLKTGNCSSAQIEALIRTHSASLHTFEAAPDDHFLVLS